LNQRHLSVRAIASGVLIGALLTPCNVYSGLKIGWTFNISIIALLVITSFWGLMARWVGAARLAPGEGNIAQTTASSSANIISGGLVAPIPALAMLSGGNLPAAELVVWVFSVSFLGIWVAWYLRESLLLRSGLAFPTGRATAETLREVFSQGREAALKLRVLLSAGAVAGVAKLLDSTWLPLPRPGLFGFQLPASGALAGYGGISAKNLTFSLEPSMLLLGFGAIIGFRAGVSLLLGAVVAWGLIGPWGLAAGFIPAGADDPAVGWFPEMIEWLLWPGVALMVASALTRFALRGRVERRRQALLDQALRDQAQEDATDLDRAGAVSDGPGARSMRVAGLALASGLVVTAQMAIFGIHWFIACATVPIAFLLAMVASRVVGETGIPPIGAIGKVSQLATGVMAPGRMTENLMGANVAGGAAGQSADLLNDFKAGLAVQAPPHTQVLAQFFGILTGSLVGTWVYLQLIPDPGAMLITEQWPAPAVATWKVVAETLANGLGAIPDSALLAVLIGGAVGVAAAVLEHYRTPRWLPSMPAVGLAMVIPASLAITMFVGSLIALALVRFRPSVAQRFVIATASGLIAGESLTGVGQALLGILGAE
jgi:putative OPT family oligopeptide transporter